MKFIVSSTALFSHLQAISRVINSRNSLPILDCFLFELRDGTLFMTASDNDTTLSTSIEVNESDSDGRFAVSSKTLLEALKEIPEQPLSFHIEPSNMEITVEYLNGKYSLMGQNADEYPQAQALGSNAVQVIMGAEILMNGVNRSIFATADDELRPVMHGIYFFFCLVVLHWLLPTVINWYVARLMPHEEQRKLPSSFRRSRPTC